MNTNNSKPFNGWFSALQVRDLLVAVQLYSGANDNQGLKSVAGSNFGERAEVMMKSFISSKSTIEAVRKFNVPLEEYELS